MKHKQLNHHYIIINGRVDFSNGFDVRQTPLIWTSSVRHFNISFYLSSRHHRFESSELPVIFAALNVLISYYWIISTVDQGKGSSFLVKDWSHEHEPLGTAPARHCTVVVARSGSPLHHAHAGLCQGGACRAAGGVPLEVVKGFNFLLDILKDGF